MSFRVMKSLIILCGFMITASFLSGCTSQEEYLSNALASLETKNYEDIATISESFKGDTVEGFKTQVLIIAEHSCNNKEYDKAIETLESLNSIVDFSEKIKEIEAYKNAFMMFNKGEELYKQIAKTKDNNKKHEIIDAAMEKYNLVGGIGDEVDKANERIKSLNDTKIELNYEDVMTSANQLFESEEYKDAINAVMKALEILDREEGKEILASYQDTYNSYRLELEKEIRTKLTADSWNKPNGEEVKAYVSKKSEKYFDKFNLYISLNKSNKDYWLNLNVGLTLPRVIDFNKIVITYDDNTYELNATDDGKYVDTTFKGTAESYKSRVDSKLVKVLVEVADSDKCTITFKGSSNITKTLDKEFKNSIKNILRYYAFMEDE